MKAYLGNKTTIAKATGLIKGMTPAEYKHQWYLNKKAQKAKKATTGLIKGMTKAEYQAQYRANNKQKLADYNTALRKSRMAQGLHTSTGKPLASIIGRIYLVQVDGQPGVKIGYSSEAPSIKVSKIQMYHTRDVNMIFMGREITGVNFLENKLHDLFEDKHIRGEWYDLTKTDIRKLKSLISKLSVVTHKTEL